MGSSPGSGRPLAALREVVGERRAVQPGAGDHDRRLRCSQGGGREGREGCHRQLPVALSSRVKRARSEIALVAACCGLSFVKKRLWYRAVEAPLPVWQRAVRARNAEGACCNSAREMPPLSRAGLQPGSMGLTGSAGLQMKPKAPAGGAGSTSLQFKPKKLGLQKPAAKAPSAFGGGADDDDDLEDDASERARVSRELQRGGGGSSLFGRTASDAAAAALEADASVFDYDASYDQMQQERSSLRQSSSARGKEEEKSSRYITSILAAHKVREMENEKLFERKLVKEAEAEAHLYGDKERFMTSAYRKKLEAREGYEAELRKKEAEEDRDDVTKRGDLSHFYSNMLHGQLTGDARGGAAQAAPTAVDSARADGAAASGGASAGDGRGDGGGGGAGSDRVGSDGGGGRESGSGAAGGVAPDDAPAPPPRATSATVDADLATSIAEATAVLRQKKSESAAGDAAAAAPAPAVSYERRNDGNSVESARERYLARKRQREQE